SMLTGRDCFGTEVVALRHKGPLTDKVRTLAEIFRDNGYASTCVGFSGNPSARGFDSYLDYEAWESGAASLPKAQDLNNVALPELERLSESDRPWFVMLRHMDPHSPYLPPEPFNRIFYQGDEFDPSNKSMDPVYAFKPFRDYFMYWIPPGVTDKDYVIAQYDGAIAYMDACIQGIFEKLEMLGVADDTIVVLNGDHGETLYDHECWFDHHGIYDVTLRVPLIIRYAKKLPAGRRIPGYNQHKDLAPTLLELAGVKTKDKFDGASLMKLVKGKATSFESEFYITECTWMRKHGWRTPQWKLIVALEPDFHFKPPVELYDLIKDPDENVNLADKHPDIVATLTARMEAFIAKRETTLGVTNPMLTQGDWHGYGCGPFTSSRQAYDTLHIGDAAAARKLQAKSRAKKKKKKK
ncbi:MAG: sulfatase, partial [Lentisphaeria bacterium]|nr:sulfatase [Lentisphaeria bacterium]